MEPIFATPDIEKRGSNQLLSDADDREPHEKIRHFLRSEGRVQIGGAKVRSSAVIWSMNDAITATERRSRRHARTIVPTSTDGSNGRYTTPSKRSAQITVDPIQSPVSAATSAKFVSVSEASIDRPIWTPSARNISSAPALKEPPRPPRSQINVSPSRSASRTNGARANRCARGTATQ